MTDKTEIKIPFSVLREAHFSAQCNANDNKTTLQAEWPGCVLAEIAYWKGQCSKRTRIRALNPKTDV